MVAWQDPNLTSSHGHNKFTITYEIISSEKRPDNQMNRAPTTKDKRVVLKQIEQTQYSQNNAKQNSNEAQEW